MDKTVAKTVQKIMGKGEKIAPVKSIKLKVKFQKAKKRVLTSGERKNMPSKEFALPGKKQGGKGGYPIPDASHARNALARVSQFGTPAEKAAVRAKVHAKYPNIGKSKRNPGPTNTQQQQDLQKYGSTMQATSAPRKTRKRAPDGEMPEYKRNRSKKRNDPHSQGNPPDDQPYRIGNLQTQEMMVRPKPRKRVMKRSAPTPASSKNPFGNLKSDKGTAGKTLYTATLSKKSKQNQNHTGPTLLQSAMKRLAVKK